MSDRDDLVSILRVRPNWLADDDPAPSDEDCWDAPSAISQRYYYGGSEVNMAALVDLVIASDWLAKVRREAAASALEAAAQMLDDDGDESWGWQVSHRLRDRAVALRAGEVL